MDSIKRIQKLFPNRLLSGRYSVIRQLGTGGFSQTFLAKDMQLPGQPLCVVKQLKPQITNMARWPIAKRLFDTEAAVLYRLGNHDQIPRLLAHFEDNQEFFLVQEYIEGASLETSLLPPWTERKTLRLLRDILGILVFVHQQQVIHRDIKPSNLIRRRQDGKLVLIDFGAVKQVSNALEDVLLEQSVTVSIGTLGYMPAEQISGSPRYNSDLYAVGMIGIQALTGVRPSQLQRDGQTGEICWQILNPSVSPAFAAILDRLVRYHFRDRYQTIDEPLQAIEQLMEEQGESAEELPEEIGDLASTALWQPEPEAMQSHLLKEIPLPESAPLVAAVEPFATALEAAPETSFTGFDEIVEKVPEKVPEKAAEKVPEKVSEPAPEAILEKVPEASARGNLEGSLPSKGALSLETLPSSPLSAPLTPAVVSKGVSQAVNLPRFHVPLWSLLMTGGVLVTAIAFSSQLKPDRLSTAPASTTSSSAASPSAPSSPSQAAILPNLPCREPPPPPLPSGKPNYEYVDGTRYYGPIGDDRPANGRGTMVFPTGNRYDGEFRSGRREGCGTYSFSSGRRYIGQFKADRFEGLGIWLLGDGNRYVGAFKDNRCHGEGVYLFKDGRVERGTWQNGKLVNGNLSCDR